MSNPFCFDVLIEIFRYLDRDDLAECAMVCKDWRATADYLRRAIRKQKGFRMSFSGTLQSLERMNKYHKTPPYIKPYYLIPHELSNAYSKAPDEVFDFLLEGHCGMFKLTIALKHSKKSRVLCILDDPEVLKSLDWGSALSTYESLELALMYNNAEAVEALVERLPLDPADVSIILYKAIQSKPSIAKMIASEHNLRKWGMIENPPTVKFEYFVKNPSLKTFRHYRKYNLVDPPELQNIEEIIARGCYRMYKALGSPRVYADMQLFEAMADNFFNPKLYQEVFGESFRVTPTQYHSWPKKSNQALLIMQTIWREISEPREAFVRMISIAGTDCIDYGISLGLTPEDFKDANALEWAFSSRDDAALKRILEYAPECRLENMRMDLEPLRKLSSGTLMRRFKQYTDIRELTFREQWLFFARPEASLDLPQIYSEKYNIFDNILVDMAGYYDHKSRWVLENYEIVRGRVFTNLLHSATNLQYWVFEDYSECIISAVEDYLRNISEQEWEDPRMRKIYEIRVDVMSFYLTSESACIPDSYIRNLREHPPMPFEKMSENVRRQLA